MGGLEGKKAIITGGSSGIGRATAALFATEGAAVAIIDRDEEGGSALQQELAEEAGEVLFVQADVSNADDCAQAVENVVAELGGIDILVNNAGIIRRTNALTMTEDEWDRVMDTNAKSVFLLCKLVIPVMIERGGGAIVNIGSGWGLTGGRDALAYCASKAAVVNMTRAMAIDHGHQNIRVNCVCPGDTDTTMLRREAQELGQEETLFLKEAADRPLKRIGSPIDIAQAVLYLAGDSSAYVTGTTLVVDGGGLAGG
ncbi:MAG TPA: SDR family NAD(P)-dependent oxidoreductase [candidate division Zixibacteria bacterium]|nr:SDR family NAD(P)-dependent oxidoreductase [candidate division Zixibacteria bacterium]